MMKDGTHVGCFAHKSPNKESQRQTIKNTHTSILQILIIHTQGRSCSHNQKQKRGPAYTQTFSRNIITHSHSNDFSCSKGE